MVVVVSLRIRRLPRSTRTDRLFPSTTLFRAHLAPDERWCLVHATHMTEAETAALAASGAVPGLCPTTEANLGDGLFPAAPYLAAGGRWGLGSDSHIPVSPVQALRGLADGPRPAPRRRQRLAGEGSAPAAGRGPHRL